MTVSNAEVIDFIARDRDGVALLVMVEEREWGDAGLLLPDLQEKLNTYYTYITTGQLVREYSMLTGARTRIELKCMHPPTRRELEFLRIVKEQVLDPAEIGLSWSVIVSA